MEGIDDPDDDSDDDDEEERVISNPFVGVVVDVVDKKPSAP